MEKTHITLDQLRQDIGGYVRRAAAGETLLVSDANGPLAEITPASAANPPPQPRPSGLCAGEFRVLDDFAEPLPDDILALFEGRETP